MKNLKTKLATGVLASTLALGVVIPALAQDDTTAESETATDDATEQTDRAAEREARRADFVSALAAELGLDETTVAEAISTVRDAQQAERSAARAAAVATKLADAVAAGDLTQAQAVIISAAIADGVRIPHLRGGHGRRGHGPRGGGFDDAATDTVADA